MDGERVKPGADRQAGSPSRVAIIGIGFRAQAFLRLASAVPDVFAVDAVVSRRPHQVVTALAHGARVLDDIAQLRARRPEFVITCVTPEANPYLLQQLVRLDIPVLSETPPAQDLRALEELWADIGRSGLVQVAEQYPLQPMNAARLAVIRQGFIGSPTSAYLSVAQTYHAVAVLRAALNVTFEEAEVRATTFSSSLVHPLTRAGWTFDSTTRETTTTIATIDFGKAVALYDFTEGQTRNPLRQSGFLVRGETGELARDHVVRMADPTTVLDSALVRRQTGVHQDFEVPDLDQITMDGQTLYRNPYYGSRLSDDEIAMATMLEAMGLWARGSGRAPYPLSVAAQDHAIGLAIQAAAQSGEPVQVAPGPWAAGSPA